MMYINKSPVIRRGQKHCGNQNPRKRVNKKMKAGNRMKELKNYQKKLSIDQQSNLDNRDLICSHPWFQRHKVFQCSRDDRGRENYFLRECSYHCCTFPLDRHQIPHNFCLKPKKIGITSNTPYQLIIICQQIRDLDWFADDARQNKNVFF